MTWTTCGNPIAGAAPHRDLSSCGRAVARLLLVGSLVVCPSPVIADQRNDLRAQIERMSPSQKEELRARQKRFERLAPDRKHQLRKLHKDLSNHQQSAQLKQVMTRYFDWLKTLSAGQVAELSELPTDERIERIKQIKVSREQHQLRQFQEMAGTRLKPSDARAVVRWFENYVALHEDEIVAAMRADTKRNRSNFKRPRDRKILFMMAITGRIRYKLPPPKNEQIERLKRELSPPAYRALQESSNKLTTIRNWIRAARAVRYKRAASEWRVDPPDEEQLEEFYLERLSAEQRDKLELLPPDRFEKELQRMYLQQARRKPDFGSKPARVPGPDRGQPRPRSGSRKKAN